MAKGGGVNYDRGAGEYAAHRKIHPNVFQELVERGGVARESAVLEVGCGTGNYIAALVERVECVGYGLDPSTGMLAHARAQGEAINWLQGRAEHLPFAAGSLDLVFSVDVIHHVADKPGFYRAAWRSLRPGGRVCTVTDSAEIIRSREILSGYFPETVDIELARYPRVVQLQAWMAEAGFKDMESPTVEAPYEISSAQPFRDRAYSSLHLISEAAWQAGLARLERDLSSGPVRGTSRYACVWGVKPSQG